MTNLPTPEKSEVRRLFAELMNLEAEKAKVEEELRSRRSQAEEMTQRHKAELNGVVVEAAKLIAQAKARERSAEKTTLIKLEGYLMALSEIDDDRGA